LLVVPPRPEVFIITKEAAPRVYRAPDPWKSGGRARLSFVRSLPERMRVTGAAASADGRWILLRSNSTLLAYDREQFARGGPPIRIDLSGLREPQGEGIAFGAGNVLYLVSESGDEAGAGMLTRLRCAFLK
jgi:hypothetical protein